MTTTSVVVVCHRAGDWLGRCLKSVIDQSDEVIVVDNGSESEEATRVAKGIGAFAIRSEENLGFAAGVNLGLRHASGELIGLLNDDAVAGPGWLRSAALMLADPSVAAVTPKVLLSQWYGDFAHEAAPGEVVVEGLESAGRVFHEPGHVYVPLPDAEDPEVRIDGELVAPLRRVRVLNHAGMYLHRHGYAADYGLGAPDDGRFDAPAERFGCSGAAPVFRSETLRRVGPLAEEYFAYNEDFDWCLRARLAGMRFLYDPGATVEHRMSATSGGNPVTSVRLLTRRNQLLTLIRNAPARVAAEHVARATFSPHRRGVRVEVARRIPWALASRRRLSQGWAKHPAEVWKEWVGVDNDWGSAHAPGRPG